MEASDKGSQGSEYSGEESEELSEHESEYGTGLELSSAEDISLFKSNEFLVAHSGDHAKVFRLVAPRPTLEKVVTLRGKPSCH